MELNGEIMADNMKLYHDTSLSFRNNTTNENLKYLLYIVAAIALYGTYQYVSNAMKSAPG